MSVIRRPGTKVWHYAFEYQGVRYRGTTGQLSKRDAQAVEAELRKRLRHRAAGIAEPVAPVGPSFQDWAEVYFEHATRTMRRPDRIEDITRVALRFWGRRPESDTSRSPDRPYHDLRLTDVAQDPTWLLKWEAWLDLPKLQAVRGGNWRHLEPKRLTWSPQTKNQYRSWLSQIYRLAMSPAYRLATGITQNPTAGTWRDPTAGREVALTADELRAVISAASYHLRLAIAIGTLAPKLREGNILALRWDTHVSPDFTVIRVAQHKTVGATGRPLVVQVPQQLREILQAARQRRPHDTHVITYQGRPIDDVRGAVRRAVTRAATLPGFAHLRYGRATDRGVTFHTLRHTAATLMAELSISPERRQKAMGHRRLETTMKYTHLKALDETAALETLSGALPIRELVLAPRSRAITPAVVEPVVDSSRTESSATAKSDEDVRGTDDGVSGSSH